MKREEIELGVKLSSERRCLELRLLTWFGGTLLRVAFISRRYAGYQVIGAEKNRSCPPKRAFMLSFAAC